MAKESVRMSAEERRESVILASMIEFAARGYNGTSTQAIATRVGVSQPYLFRLFPNKRALFEAAVGRCIEELRTAFLEAAKGLEGEEARAAMGDAYFDLIADRSRLLLQLQLYVSVAAAEANGETEVGETVRAMWLDLWDTVAAAAGMSAEEAGEFFGQGMLINVLVALGFPAEHRVWASCGPKG